MVVEKATLEEISLCMRLWDFFFYGSTEGYHQSYTTCDTHTSVSPEGSVCRCERRMMIAFLTPVKWGLL